VLTMNAIGTYSRDHRYGVWAQVAVPVAGRNCPVDIEITPPTLDVEAADNLAAQLHAHQGEGCELLLFLEVSND
jgi:hypothetical protein